MTTETEKKDEMKMVSMRMTVEQHEAIKEYATIEKRSVTNFLIWCADCYGKNLKREEQR